MPTLTPGPGDFLTPNVGEGAVYREACTVAGHLIVARTSQVNTWSLADVTNRHGVCQRLQTTLAGWSIASLERLHTWVDHQCAATGIIDLPTGEDYRWAAHVFVATLLGNVYLPSPLYATILGRYGGPLFVAPTDKNDIEFLVASTQAAGAIDVLGQIAVLVDREAPPLSPSLNSATVILAAEPLADRQAWNRLVVACEPAARILETRYQALGEATALQRAAQLDTIASVLPGSDPVLKAQMVLAIIWWLAEPTGSNGAVNDQLIEDLLGRHFMASGADAEAPNSQAAWSMWARLGPYIPAQSSVRHQLVAAAYCQALQASPNESQCHWRVLAAISRTTATGPLATFIQDAVNSLPPGNLKHEIVDMLQ